MKQIFAAEMIGLSPAQERAARRRDDLASAHRAARPRMYELTGLLLSGAFARRRIKAGKVDYSRADAKATRGVRLVWTLESGPLYEAHYQSDPAPTSWVRRIITVAADGRLLDLSEEEARTCLASVTSASTS